MEMKKYHSLYIIIRKDKEIFRPINFIKENKLYTISPIYEISNYGRVINNITGHIISQQTDKLGYKRVNLKVINDINGESSYTPLLVHRLVAMTFNHGYDSDIGRVIVNHLNSDPSDNYYENLEWCTQAENLAHAIAVGNLNLIKQAVVNAEHNRIYGDDIIDMIAQLLACECPPSKIQEALNLGDKKIKSIYGIIERLRYDERYEYLRSKYNVPINILNISDEKEIHEICKLLEQGYFARDIISMKNITDPKEKARMSTKISKIRLGKHFTEISSQYNIPKTDATNNKIYNDEIVHTMCKLFEDGYSNTEILNILNLDTSTKKSRKYLISLRGRFIRPDITKYYDW